MIESGGSLKGEGCGFVGVGIRLGPRQHVVDGFIGSTEEAKLGNWTPSLKDLRSGLPVAIALPDPDRYVFPLHLG